MANNCGGLQALQWLRKQDDEIVGLVLHRPPRCSFHKEMIAGGGLPEDRIFDGSKLRESALLERIAACDADMALSVHFG